MCSCVNSRAGFGRLEIEIYECWELRQPPATRIARKRRQRSRGTTAAAGVGGEWRSASGPVNVHTHARRTSRVLVCQPQSGVGASCKTSSSVRFHGDRSPAGLVVGTRFLRTRRRRSRYIASRTAFFEAQLLRVCSVNT